MKISISLIDRFYDLSESEQATFGAHLIARLLSHGTINRPIIKADIKASLDASEKCPVHGVKA